MWPVDKLSIIIDCLGQTGNNSAVAADDGSEEWNVSSTAYEAAIAYAIESHDWKFSTTVGTLTRTGTAPEDSAYTDAYAKPADLLHAISVKMGNSDVDYIVVGNQIYVNAGGDTIEVKYVRQPTPDQVTPTFMMAMRAFVKSGIYEGLKKNYEEASNEWKKGEAFLNRAKTRADQETPSRAMFTSNLVAARSRRRG